PFGQTVRDLIFNSAGGLPPGRTLKAIATSGPSGGFLPVEIPVTNLPEKFVKERLPAGAKTYNSLDPPLDLNTVGQMGGLVRAAFVVYDDRRDMVENALNCVAFYRNESCGKCVPCRVGSQKLVDLIGDLLARQLPREQLALFGELSEAMSLASICGLGQVASNPIASVLKHFPRDVEKYLTNGRP